MKELFETVTRDRVVGRDLQLINEAQEMSEVMRELDGQQHDNRDRFRWWWQRNDVNTIAVKRIEGIIVECYAVGNEIFDMLGGK